MLGGQCARSQRAAELAWHRHRDRHARVGRLSVFQVRASAAAVVTCGPATWIRPRPGSPLGDVGHDLAPPQRPRPSATACRDRQDVPLAAAASVMATSSWNWVARTMLQGTGPPLDHLLLLDLHPVVADRDAFAADNRDADVVAYVSVAARRRAAGASPGPGPAPRAWARTALLASTTASQPSSAAARPWPEIRSTGYSWLRRLRTRTSWPRLGQLGCDVAAERAGAADDGDSHDQL